MGCGGSKDADETPDVLEDVIYPAEAP